MIKALLLDSREPAWVQNLKFDNAIKAVTALEYGDAMVTTDTGDLVLIERKAPGDLLNSIKDNRLFSQVAGMRQQTSWVYVVVTGILTATLSGKVAAEERVTGWEWNSVQGALLTVQDLGGKIIYCQSDKDYECTVIRLCNRERRKEYVLEPAAAPRIMSPGEIMLTALPGIGLERAQLLLREFNNRPCDALAWLTWHRWHEEHPIAGIGQGIKRGVRTALNIEEHMILDICPDEKAVL